MKKLLITLCGVVLIGGAGYVGYEHMKPASHFDKDIQVAPTSSSTSEGSAGETSSESENQDAEMSNSVKSNGSESGSKYVETGLDDTYGYVLVFADGTKRLAKSAPSSQFWRQGTSSSYGNGHTGRTSYNQLQPQLGGVASVKNGTPEENEKAESMMGARYSAIIEEYKADDRAMRENSVPSDGE